MGDYKDLLVFRKSYSLAMEIFGLSKRFPKEEQYSLTDQSEGILDLFVLTLAKVIDEEVSGTFYLKTNRCCVRKYGNRNLVEFFKGLWLYN